MSLASEFDLSARTCRLQRKTQVGAKGVIRLTAHAKQIRYSLAG